eukprot:CAMPEP_0178439470 /NCGR_PEP_ID=MMETSP0689_2-20121128/36176_1 /TAXON_ID=160604 /ORGANISM="Amphidinium massartii, Strain CS-259" /LENGTH=54 /DNA_ID=CAMNT_0020062007 /DNA_START=234 /DNA_END=398 /DNA_ORIENTATION=-
MGYGAKELDSSGGPELRRWPPHLTCCQEPQDEGLPIGMYMFAEQGIAILSVPTA